MLTVVWAMERLRPFLLSLNITVYTDCQSLIYVNSNSNFSAFRWNFESKIQILEKPVNKRTRRERREVLDYVLNSGILYKNMWPVAKNCM